MLTFLAKRLLQLIPTLFFVSLLIFGLQQLLPGDPALAMAGEERDPQVLEQIRRQYRLDQPFHIQYVYWVAGVLSGNLGESMRLKEPVLTLILQKFPVTLQLALMAIVISLAIGLTAGVISAVRRNTRIDYAVNVLALAGISTPNFWLGILLIFLFSVYLGWLPASGYVSPFEDFWLSLKTTILPAFVLGNSFAAVLMRHTRSAMLQAMTSDYVRTARAKGLSERVVVLKHAMRNALTPVITLGALELAHQRDRGKHGNGHDQPHGLVALGRVEERARDLDAGPDDERAEQEPDPLRHHCKAGGRAPAGGRHELEEQAPCERHDSAGRHRDREQQRVVPGVPLLCERRPEHPEAIDD